MYFVGHLAKYEIIGFKIQELWVSKNIDHEARDELYMFKNFVNECRNLESAMSL